METESRELAAVSRGKIKAGETDDWKSEQLFVPPLPPTNLRGCHMIRIQYDVFVSITSNVAALTWNRRYQNNFSSISHFYHVVSSTHFSVIWQSLQFYFSSSWPLAILRNPLNCSFLFCWLPILYETKMEPCAARQKPSTLPRFQSSDHGWMKKTCDNQPQMRTMKTLFASNCSHDLSPSVMTLSDSSSTFL